MNSDLIKRFQRISGTVPTAYTPFLRRFTDERALEERETQELIARVQSLYRASPISRDDIFERLFQSFWKITEFPASEKLWRAFHLWLTRMVDLEPFAQYFPEWKPTYSLTEQVATRNKLRELEHFLTREDQFLSTFLTALSDYADGTQAMMPSFPEDPESFLFQAPLAHFFDDVNQLIVGTINAFNHEDELELGMFHAISEQLYRNVCRVSKQVPFTPHNRPLTFPYEARLPADEAVGEYLADTPFLDLFQTPLPITIPDETFFSHMHIVGGSGAGKTQFLANLILHHIEREATVIVVDSQSDLINQLVRLDEIKDFLTYITPRDIDHPPAINIFDIGSSRVGGYTRAMQEQLMKGAIDTLDYLFTGIVGAELTSKQGIFFEYVMRLLITLPQTMGRNATLVDMMRLMADMEPYQKAIGKLPALQREFFEHDFRGHTFKQTKEQVRYRIAGILANPTFERLFTSPYTKLDIFEEINSRRVILIDTAKDFLKDASAHYGRIFISLILKAVMERAAIPEAERHPVFLIVDEAAEYFDENIDDLLTQVRKYKCGCTFAHQYMDQCTSQLKSSLAANTAIKMASAVSTHDARVLAPEMRTTPEFILSQPRLQFATFIRGMFSHSIATPVNVGALDERDFMDDETFKAFLAYNAQRIAIDPAEIVEEPEEPDEDDDEEEAKKDSPFDVDI